MQENKLEFYFHKSQVTSCAKYDLRILKYMFMEITFDMRYNISTKDISKYLAIEMVTNAKLEEAITKNKSANLLILKAKKSCQRHE